jgi:hypothetical protein
MKVLLSKKVVRCLLQKKTLYSPLQNKIAATFMSHEITYEDNIRYICSVMGADLNYTKERSCMGSVIIHFIEIN